MKVQITFEIPDHAPNFASMHFPQTSLHEALCQLIHEDQPVALDWLQVNVMNIDLTSDDSPHLRTTQPTQTTQPTPPANVMVAPPHFCFTPDNPDCHRGYCPRDIACNN